MQSPGRPLFEGGKGERLFGLDEEEELLLISFLSLAAASSFVSVSSPFPLVLSPLELPWAKYLFLLQMRKKGKKGRKARLTSWGLTRKKGPKILPAGRK